MEDYRRIADRLADDITAGRLKPGQRLMPQRQFARRRGIAGSTAGRVYAELVRRGLVVGEVGRGTFVRATPAGPESRALIERASAAPVNMELNYPVAEGQSELLAPHLAPLLRPDVLAEALLPAPATGTAPAREAVATLLTTGIRHPEPGGLLSKSGGLRPGPGGTRSESGGLCSESGVLHPESGGLRSGPEGTRSESGGLRFEPGGLHPESGGPRPEPAGWRPEPHRVLFTGNARQAIAATLASLVRPGGRVGVEPLTYPLVKEIAARLGIVLVPLAADADGPLPESVLAVHRTAPLSALYLQPTLHNPTSLTMSEERRRQLAHIVGDLELPVVEDRIWSFLHPAAPDPLAAHAPALTHVVDSLSKRVAPGLTVGFAVVPEHRVDAVAAAIRSGGWSAGRFALEAAVRVIAAGVVERLVEAKRADAALRQRIVGEELDGFVVRAHPRVFYAWWELPAPWRADTFTAAAAAHGIAVTPGPAFAVDPSRTPDAVRLGLASAAVPDLRRALGTLAGVARSGR